MGKPASHENLMSPTLAPGGAALVGLALTVGILLVGPRPSIADDSGPPRGLKDAAALLSRSAPAGPKAELGERVKHAAWSLIVGELAADPRRGMLYSAGVDALGTGLAELDRIEAELKADPRKEVELSKVPALAMQLDGARVRRGRIEAKLELSRKQERERLTQLRELVGAYRDVANSLAVSNAFLLTGDVEATRSANREAARKLAELEAIVGRRRDYYLFSDEPALDGAGSSELKLVSSAPQPFSAEMKPHMEALQALALYRLAADGPEAPEPKALEEALALAERAVGEGPDKNAVALYVVGNVRRQLGLALTSKDPLDPDSHGQAAAHFDAARSSFRELQSLRDKHPAPLKGLGAEVERHIRELASPTPFLEEAERLMLAGRPAEADALLARGRLYHRSAPLLMAHLELTRRAELDLAVAADELKRGIATGLVRGDDPLARLVGAKLALARCWRTATSSLESLGARERSELEREVAAQQQALGVAAAAAPSIALQLRAYASLAAAIRSMVNPSLDARGQEAELRQAAGAASGLLGELSRVGRESWDTVSLREALVACRVAQGFLAVRVLPSYRDEATNAFAAAADEQAKLPFQGSALKVLGSPLVTAMLSRPEGQSVRLAQEERQLRHVVSRFLEGAFSQSLGSDSGAATQMAAALEEVRSLPADGPADAAPLDAGRMLDRSDTADARKSTVRQIRSFSALSFIKAGHVRRGVVEAVRTVAGDVLPTSGEEEAFGAITPELLERSIRGAGSPLEAFTLGTALEAQAASAPAGAALQPSAWLAAALQAQRRARDLFDGSKAARDRFPELVELNLRAVRRLTGPEDDLAEAQRLRRDSRFPEASRRLRAALVRHPQAPELRVELALCVCDQVDLGQADRAALEDALRSLQPCRGSATAGLIIGEIEERLGRTGQALRSYQSVLARSQSAEERIKAGTRIAILSAQPGG